MALRTNNTSQSCLELCYFPEENVGYAKVACVALALLFLGAGIAVLSQQVILIPRLKFIMGGYLMGLSLFPAVTFAVLHCCKKPEKKEPLQEIPPLHSKLYEQIITHQPHRASNDKHPNFFLHAPIEILNHIYVWAEQDLTRYRLSRLCISFFKRFYFIQAEMNAMGWHLGQLGRGNRAESTLQRRNFRNLFAPGVCQIKSIQVVGQKIYVLEDRSFGTRLSAIMVWDMEQNTFTDDLFEVRGEISSFRVDGDNLYFIHMRKGTAELLDYLTAPEITSSGLDFIIPGHYIDETWILRVWDLKGHRIMKEHPLTDYQFGVQVSNSLCATQSYSSVYIYNKENLTLVHVLTGVDDFVLHKTTLFFKGALTPQPSYDKYLGQIDLDKIPEHKPELPISLVGNGSAPETVRVLSLESEVMKIACFSLWKEQILCEKWKILLKGRYGELSLINLQSPDLCLTPIKMDFRIDRMLPFGHGVVAQTYSEDTKKSTFHILNLQRRSLWGSIECSSRITAFDIFNGDSIVAGFADGSIRMWSYSPE